ncbi:helix-turn-helix domain-containing protein [Halovivax sp.]|uniref:helix-turn-helix domain-containing protein n=1 Tax=Halovivax sp. TaxID=1935978 RepID=UPI0025C28EA6|nr:helix-turn-helix domain-containing protein [Halovivax sp.]
MSSEPSSPGHRTDAGSDSTVEPAVRLDVLGNECSRTILVATQDGPRTAKELTERTDCSSATVYRRINDLLDGDLLEECVRFEEGGSHTTAYRATVEEVRVHIEPNGIEVSVTGPDA